MEYYLVYWVSDDCQVLRTVAHGLFKSEAHAVAVGSRKGHAECFTGGEYYAECCDIPH